MPEMMGVDAILPATFSPFQWTFRTQVQGRSKTTTRATKARIWLWRSRCAFG